MRNHPYIGKRVAFVSSNDQYTRLIRGTKGTVSFVDDMGTVFVNWDDGSSLGMVNEAGDRYEFINEEEG